VADWALIFQAFAKKTQTPPLLVVRFPRKKRERSTNQIAPSSRHRDVEQLLAQQHEDVSVRQLAS